jgi:hypothetical protein
MKGRTFGGGNMQQMTYESVRCYAWDKLTCIGNLIARISSWCDSVFFCVGETSFSHRNWPPVDRGVWWMLKRRAVYQNVVQKFDICGTNSHYDAWTGGPTTSRVECSTCKGSDFENDESYFEIYPLHESYSLEMCISLAMQTVGVWAWLLAVRNV